MVYVRNLFNLLNLLGLKSQDYMWRNHAFLPYVIRYKVKNG